MRRHSASSFDVDAAGKLSRRLAGGGLQPELPESDAQTGTYLRFRAPQGAPEATPTEAPEGAEPQPQVDLDAVAQEMDSWPALLAWAMDVARSRAAFVVDSQGFVIASRGNVPSDGFAGTGAELCFTMEQLTKIDPDAGELRSVELDFKGRSILGLRAAGDGELLYILGLVGPASLPQEVKDAVSRQLHLCLGKLH
ncbi:MAG: hypothetical protein GY856_09765 [bacterium]|nr:hypothetical protein [bacterium]